MTTQTSRTVERQCDVAVIGGSAAGLAAALQLGRQHRSVIVIDAGEPRNAPAANVHGYLGHENIAPAALNRIARNEVRSYGGEVLAGRAANVTRPDDDHFRVELVGGHTVIARRVLAATGIVDELPDIEGLREHWGDGVIHCPFCHGYEVRDQRVVQIITHPMGLHTAVLFRQLSEHLTLILHSDVESDQSDLDQLRVAGVNVVDGRAQRVVSDADGRITSVELDSGSHVEADVVVVSPRFRPRADAFASLGVTLAEHASGLGEVIAIDDDGETGVAGLYAAGNVTDPSQQVLSAAAHGSRVGSMISFSLGREDIDKASRRSVQQTEWDSRYSNHRIWSGNPNGSLVREATSLRSGRALDVGAGEGGDAIWLAERGWQVTAADISQRAVDQISQIAADRDLAVDCISADANSDRPFEPERFDLVTAHYASIPRTPDLRGVHNMLAAVAPSGTLLVVGHDPEPMRAPIDPKQHSRAFDPDAYVSPGDFAAVLDESDDWHVEVHEKRARPLGHTEASHHVDDIVLRALRSSVPAPPA